MLVTQQCQTASASKLLSVKNPAQQFYSIVHK